MIWIELCILLACILIGARLGGIALGTIAGIGLAIFVFAFAMPPGGPPGTVIGMIIAVITALAAMQAAGGLDYLVSVAEKVMRRHSRYITFVAPVVTYLLVLASGTTHVIYALLPVIAEVSRKAGIRPERPANRRIASPLIRPHQHQVSQVDADDQQNRPHRSEQKRQRAPRTSRDLLLKWN